MTKQAPHVAALKAGFLEQFGSKLSVRRSSKTDEHRLLLSVPTFLADGGADRLLLVSVGRWLESRGFYLVLDHGRVGLLSSPDGWTCWEGGASVHVRFSKE